MQALKVIALGLFFSTAASVIYLFISIVLGGTKVEPSHATGLSAVMAGIIEAFF